MKTIPNTFTKPGYRYELAYRSKTVAVYNQTHIQSDKLAAFEVMLIDIAEKESETPWGKVSVGDESFPPTSAWGRTAWTVQTTGRAAELYNLLNKS